MINYPLVTIGIPTYNRADGFLKEALQCAVAQTYPRVEIIVSDNCSSDGTPELVRSFADPRIIYHRHEVNVGAANNFNFCLEQAKGDYFLMLHDDDMIDPDFVETCMRRADYSSGFGLIRTGVRVIDEHGSVLSESRNKVENLPYDKFLLGWFNGDSAWYLCNTLFNTAKLKALGGFKSRHNLLQDCAAVVKLAAREQRVDIEDIKASFRKHSGEITFSVKVKAWTEDFIYLLDLIRAQCPGDIDIGREAKRFFAFLCYKRAAAVKKPFDRLSAYWVVFIKFDCEYYPPPIKRIGKRISLMNFAPRLGAGR